ncbi:protein of unknown function [Streptomyces sp. KY75]|nr:protein of unknown function [Streptomyces sp. KY75]
MTISTSDGFTARPPHAPVSSHSGQGKRYSSPLPELLGLIIADDRERACGNPGQRGHPGSHRQEFLFSGSGDEEDVGVPVFLALVMDFDTALVLKVDQEVLDLVDPGVRGGAVRQVRRRQQRHMYLDKGGGHGDILPAC